MRGGVAQHRRSVALTTMRHSEAIVAVAVALCAFFVALLVRAEYTGSARVRSLAKPAASVCFVVAGAAALPHDHPARGWMLAALVLSALGDVLLLRMSAEAWFLAGVGAFGLAHVAYAAAFVTRGVAPFAIEGAAFVALLAAALVLAWLVPRVPAKLRGAIFGYAAVISAMIVCAVGTVAAHGGPKILVGAVMFYASDLAVARDRFVAPGFVNRAWGLPLYYAAQLVLATSVE